MRRRKRRRLVDINVRCRTQRGVQVEPLYAGCMRGRARRSRLASSEMTSGGANRTVDSCVAFASTPRSCARARTRARTHAYKPAETYGQSWTRRHARLSRCAGPCRHAGTHATLASLHAYLP
eukprot:6074284-Pleurochrysis_carterae.AAC.2